MTKKLTASQIRALTIAVRAEEEAKQCGMERGTVYGSNMNAIRPSGVGFYHSFYVYVGTAEALVKVGLFARSGYLRQYVISDAGRAAAARSDATPESEA